MASTWEGDTRNKRDAPRGRERKVPAPVFRDLSGFRVLVIDDHGDSLELMVEVLTHCNAEVIAARDTAEARQLLMDRIPDVILTDMNLPDETGLQFAEWIRVNAPNAALRAIPIVAMTATSPRFAEDPPPTVDAVVRKPIDLDQVCEIIWRVSAERRRPQEP